MSARPKDSEAVADRLREHPPVLDELTRARLERRVILARSVGRGPEVRPTRGWLPIAGGLGLAMAAVALLLVLGPRIFAPTSPTVALAPSEPADRDPAGRPGDGETEAPAARFEVRELRATARRGTLEEGSVLPTTAGEVADIRVGDSRVHIAPSSRVRIVSLAPERLALELDEGEVRIAFHPRERGREHLTVETPEARVEVVGTVFTVRRSPGATEVAVSEGVVRVVPLVSGDPRLVRAGERTRVEVAADTEVAPTIAPSAETATIEAPAPDPRTQLARARELAARGQAPAATPLLRAVVASDASPQLRAQAFTLIGDLAERDGQYEEAATSYEIAARLGRGTMTGSNAIFALARLEQRRIGDRAAAVRSYRRYLEEAPRGPLAAQVRQALCQLGDESRCEGP